MVAKIYTRLSRDETNQTSTADQERECRRLAERLDIRDIEVFPEQPGTSAYKDVPRPVFDSLISGINKGDVILAWALDRLTRHGMEEAGKVLRILEERGARLITVSDGVDTQLDADINVGIRAIMARDYSKRISANVKRGKTSRAQRGEPNSSCRWYGYNDDRTINEDEAQILRQCYTWFVSGERMITIATRLNEMGLKTITGAEWRSGNLQKLLRNRRYIGFLTHDEVEYRGSWDPIFTEEQ
jgi:site-specific DNA recombinase